MLLKRLIFLYFLLLIFEGALRKWVLPGLATPLLIVRDPVVIAIYLLAFQYRVFPINNWTLGAGALAVASSLMSILVGHGDIFVTTYGLRANFLHIPLIFVMALVLDRDDMRVYARWILYLTIPMTGLVVLQFLSPTSAFVNIGVGGEGTASFSGAAGRMRSSGTFSFISGLVSFYTLAFASWVALSIDRGRTPFWLVAASGVAILLAIPLSISRALLISVAIIAIGGAFVIARLPGWGSMLPRLTIMVGISLFGASQLPVFDEAVDVFGARWDTASRIEGGGSGMLNRVIENLTGPIKNLAQVDLFGSGVGAGTMAGAQMLRGRREFLGGEGEWWRLLWEMGVFLGLPFIAYRFWLTVRLALFGWQKLDAGNPLPWLFFLASGGAVLNGQWGQATALGFAVFGAGMVLASGQEPKTSDA
jgi:hypothetical protein